MSDTPEETPSSPPPVSESEESVDDEEEAAWQASFELSSPDGTEVTITVEGSDDSVAEVVHAGLESYLRRRHERSRPRAASPLERLLRSLGQGLAVGFEQMRAEYTAEGTERAPDGERLQ